MPSLDDKYEVRRRHLAILRHSSGTLVALAGPGTGKTYCLRKRVRELVDKQKVLPETIVYVTFIREISRAFRDDLSEEFEGPGSVPRIGVSTLHSLALALIRNKGHLIGFAGQLVPLNTASKRGLLARTFQQDMRWQMSGEYKPSTDTLRTHLDSAKKQWQKGVQFPQLGQEGALVMEAYYHLSTGFKAIDWDQVVVCANQICEELPVLPHWLSSIEHFLVDEYQDFNPAEQRFLREIMTGAGSAVIVGDDDQSLYSGRGASPKGIVDFASAPQVSTVSLVVTYRCLSEIVSVANRFLKYMRVAPRELVPHKTGGRVRIKRFKSAKAETDFLADYLRSALGTIGVDPPKRAGIVCLFPSWRVLKQYQRELESRGVLCSVKLAGRLTEQEMWARVLARLAVLRSQPLLERVLLEVFPAIKPRHQKQVIAKVLSNGCSTREAVALLTNDGYWHEDARLASAQYENFINALISTDPGSVSACFERILSGAGKCDANLIEGFLAMADEGNLEDAVDGLVRNMFQPEETGPHQPETTPVELMTMHGAKGLTRRYVVIPACENCWLPGNVSPAQLPERMRLFYVAITRATHELLITYPSRRARGDSLNYEQPGRFELSRFAQQLGVQLEWDC